MTKYNYAKSLLYQRSEDIMKIYPRDLASLLLLLSAKECGIILEKIDDLGFYTRAIAELISKNPRKVVIIICKYYISLERFTKIAGDIFPTKKELLLNVAEGKDKETLRRLFILKIL